MPRNQPSGQRHQPVIINFEIPPKRFRRDIFKAIACCAFPDLALIDSDNSPPARPRYPQMPSPPQHRGHEARSGHHYVDSRPPQYTPFADNHRRSQGSYTQQRRRGSRSSETQRWNDVYDELQSRPPYGPYKPPYIPPKPDPYKYRKNLIQERIKNNARPSGAIRLDKIVYHPDRVCANFRQNDILHGPNRDYDFIKQRYGKDLKDEDVVLKGRKDGGFEEIYRQKGKYKGRKRSDVVHPYISSS